MVFCRQIGASPEVPSQPGIQLNEVIDHTMASHTTETQGTRQTVLAPRRDKCATSTSVWFAYVGTQAQSNGHSQGFVTQSHATGSDRKRVKPVSGVLSFNGPPSGLVMFLC